jgi:hypothetical protein
MLTPASHQRCIDVYNFYHKFHLMFFWKEELTEVYCSKFCVSPLIVGIKDYILTDVT